MSIKPLTKSQIEALRIASNNATEYGSVWGGGYNYPAHHLVSNITAVSLVKHGYFERVGDGHLWIYRITDLGRLCISHGHEYAQSTLHLPLRSVSDWNGKYYGRSILSGYDIAPGSALTSGGMVEFEFDTFMVSPFIYDNLPDYKWTRCPSCHSTQWHMGEYLNAEHYRCTDCDHYWERPLAKFDNS